MLRIVLDTNEYISGVIKKQSNPAKIIQAWREGEIDLLISPSIKEEIERVIRYPKIKDKYHLTEEDLQDLLNNLEKDAIWPSVFMPLWLSSYFHFSICISL